MTHTYIVTGMTCNGCRASVEDTLNALQHVENATVNLERGEAIIKMSQHIEKTVLQKALPKKYEISKKNDTDIFKANIERIEQEKSELQQLFPLFLIFLFITSASVLLNYRPWSITGFMLDFMGLFYVVFSFFKFLDLKGFSETFRMYDPLAKAFPMYGWLYPFIEIGLGLLFLMRVQIKSALIMTLVILGITTIGVIRTLINKKSIQCACLGTALKLPMTKATLIENSIMIVMAISMLLKIIY